MLLQEAQFRRRWQTHALWSWTWSTFSKVVNGSEKKRGGIRGEKRGERIGSRNMVYRLVRERKLSEEDGAAALEMTLKAFTDAMSESAGGSAEA